MDNKDLIYLMLIFCLNNKGKYRYDSDLLLNFRDDVYSYIKDCQDITMFKVRFLTSGLQLDEPSWRLRKKFIDFVNKIEKVYNSSQS